MTRPPFLSPAARALRIARGVGSAALVAGLVGAWCFFAWLAARPADGAGAYGPRPGETESHFMYRVVRAAYHRPDWAEWPAAGEGEPKRAPAWPLPPFDYVPGARDRNSDLAEDLGVH